MPWILALLLTPIHAADKPAAIEPCVEKIDKLLGEAEYREPATLKELLACQKERRQRFHRRKNISNGDRVRFRESQREEVDSYLRRHPEQAATVKEEREKRPRPRKHDKKKKRKNDKKSKAPQPRAPKVDLEAPSLDDDMPDLFKDP